MPALKLALEKISSADIDGIIKDGWIEDEEIEFKQEVPSRDGRQDRWYFDQSGLSDYGRNQILAEIVAFANTYGGDLVIGIIETEDKPGMLARLTEAIARFEANIRQIEADTARPGRGSIEVVIEVSNRAHLERIRQAVRNLPGVLEVTRRMAGTTKAGEDAF